jgi:BirA family biotin operon repressor/biotin-[acetyl-CoA-carboxylase] ligase
MTVELHEQVTSTNTLCREAATAGADEWTVLIAASQTAGRGRQGHTFWSPDHSGVYLSVLVRPDWPIDTVITALTPLAAVAAARAVESISERQADIKWVNDVYCDKKKVCGILVEGHPNAQTDRFSYAVVGVGFNVFPPKGGFPEEIRNRAGAVLEEPSAFARERLAAAFLNEFYTLYQSLPTVAFHGEYTRRALRLGRSVSVPTEAGERAAEVLDVTERFELRVRFEDGAVRDLNSGDVSVRFV